jgi:hypothetical protein
MPGSDQGMRGDGDDKPCSVQSGVAIRGVSLPLRRQRFFG